MKESLSTSLVDSIGSTTTESLGNFLELGLDAILEDGLLKEIPFVSTAISIYKIGKSLTDRHNIKKLAVFLNEINQNTANENKREEYKSKINNDKKKREHELEFLLVILERYIGYEKPAMLAKLYLAYLDKQITWDDLVLLAEIVDRFLPGDYDTLSSAQMFTTYLGNGDQIMLRLEALGLIIEEKESSPFINTSRGLAITKESLQQSRTKKRTYVYTDLGEIAVKLLGRKTLKDGN